MGVITRSVRIQWLNAQDYFQYYRNRLITFLVFRSMASILLLSISKLINVIRNQHIRTIEERENYFGIERERLDIPRRVKKSLTGWFKPHVATVVVMAVLTFIRIFEMILNKHMISVTIFFFIDYAYEWYCCDIINTTRNKGLTKAHIPYVLLQIWGYTFLIYPLCFNGFCYSRSYHKSKYQ